MADSNTGRGATSDAASAARGDADEVAAVDKRVLNDPDCVFDDASDYQAYLTFRYWDLDERQKVIKELDLLFPSEAYDRSVVGPRFINMEVSCRQLKSILNWRLYRIDEEIEDLKSLIDMGLPAIDHGDGDVPSLDELEEFLGEQERYKMAMSNKATAEDKK